nr:hypothetical protein [uncultured Roseateles sp.]
MKWTTRDEQRMSQLEKELQELQARRKDAQEPLRQMVAELCEEFQIDAVSEYVALWLLDNADRVRDALAPFDSGVRPGPDAATLGDPSDPTPVTFAPADCSNARAQQGLPYLRTCPRCGTSKSCPYGMEMPAPTVPRPQP